MNILNVNMSIDPVLGGGTAERTMQMSVHLAKKGIPCRLLTIDTGLPPEYIRTIEKRGVEVHALPSFNNRYYLPEFGFFKTIKDLVEQADIVHLMNHWTVLNALVFLSARRFSKPFVICPAGALPIFGRSGTLKRIYNFTLGNTMIRHAAGCIAISPDEIGQFEDCGVKADRIAHIPNGISPDDFQTADDACFREKYGIGNSPFILFMGRLNLIKGPDLLLKAFCGVKNKIDKYHLVFAGPDGGMLNELKQLSRKYNADDNVHFIGYIGGIHKSMAYHAADIVVIPSRREAMSIVAIEAGITRTPVLMTDKCGFNDVEKIGGGMVVQSTVESLGKGLVNMLKDIPALKRKGENLYKYTYDNFIWDKIVDDYIRLYQRILDGEMNIYVSVKNAE